MARDIAEIKIDVRSRDDIPLILLGLQHIYCTDGLREQVFGIIKEMLPTQVVDGQVKPVSAELGSPGMNQWTILVLGCLRLCLNAGNDRLHELANQHRTLRLMLGIADWDEKTFSLQTLKDNLRLFTPEILARINQVVVGAGYGLLGKKNTPAPVAGRCDSFVVETDVHFPTDINLLFDAMRVLLHICPQLSGEFGLKGWRQSKSCLKKLKKALRIIQKLKHSTAKDGAKKQAKTEQIVKAHQTFIDLSAAYLERAGATLAQLATAHQVPELQLAKPKQFIAHAKRQIDQIERRVIKGETIPHGEKVFSLFEPHTEWVSKGKAGVPVELGVRVAVVESREGFILHHQVMEKTTDDKIAVETQALFPGFKACSFDKGFHSPANQTELKAMLDQVTLPKKGKLSLTEQARETDEAFVAARKAHSAVESGINALEVHGLDVCLDHGIDGFKRYVALAVLSRNIQKIGQIKRDAGRERLARERERLRQRQQKLAA
ncbi:MAG: ISNCY family transposase [Methylococcales bacterium]|nr:ISNCY family transposase [Methylococcales bacterium]